MIVRGKSTLDRLAQWLAETSIGGIGAAPVINKTGLTGIYEYEFIRSGSGGGQRGATSSRDIPRALPGMGPEEHAQYIAQVLGPNWVAAGRAADISDALENALGLKLQEQEMPVDMLVIDQIDRPTPD